jgi:hypothetical protein
VRSNGIAIHWLLAADCGRMTGQRESNPKVRLADDPGAGSIRRRIIIYYFWVGYSL